MKRKQIVVVLCAVFFCLPALSFAIDFWQFPESADKNSVFVDVRFGGLYFEEKPNFFPPIVNVDYMLWGGLPFSVGAYIAAPEPNLKSFGTRLGYHVNFDSAKFDFYFLYVFDFGWTLNKQLKAHGDKTQEMHFYDFRAGIRKMFSIFALQLETDFKLRGIHAGVSIKLF
jgi:hypothetical protein